MLWQYRTVLFEFTKDGLLGDRYVDDEEMESTLNTLGRQAWEVVSVSLLQDGLLAILKRPLDEQLPPDPMPVRGRERVEIAPELCPDEPAFTNSIKPTIHSDLSPVALRNPVVDESETSDPFPPRRTFERPLRTRKETEDDDFIGGIRIA